MEDIIKRLLFGNVKKKRENIYIWNSMAGLINAGKSVILSILVTRICGLESAGVLSLAFAISNLLMTIGKYGMRNFQVTDIENKYNFSDYFSARIITVFAMGIISLGYVIVNARLYDYFGSKIVVIIGISTIFCIECIEDVFAGDFQKKGELDVGSRIFVYRWIIMLVMWGISLLITKSLAYSVIVALGTCILCVYFFVKKTHNNKDFRFKIQKPVISILKTCTPLCASNFMIYYVANASKYSIDKFLGEELQAVYGFLSMAIFAIGLLSSFIYQPILTQLAADWENQKWALLTKKLGKQIICILGISLLAIGAAYFWGTSVLSLLYNTDLNMYRNMLVCLVIGSGAYAIEGYFGVVLTVMRKQNWIVGIYTLVTVVVFLLSDIVVKYWKLWGATILFMNSMFLLAVFLFALIAIFIYKESKLAKNC